MNRNLIASELLKAAKELTAAKTTTKEWNEALKNNRKHLEQTRKFVKMLEKGEALPEADKHLSLANAKKTVRALEQVIKNIEDGLRK